MVGEGDCLNCDSWDYWIGRIRGGGVGGNGGGWSESRITQITRISRLGRDGGAAREAIKRMMMVNRAEQPETWHRIFYRARELYGISIRTFYRPP